MKRLFILDDNEELLEIMEKILSKEYTLMLKKETDFIVDHIISFRPDLVILDHTIGEESSAKVIVELKSNDQFHKVPIVLFSAHLELAKLSTAMGADGYIEKPCGIAEMRQYIKAFFEQKV